MDSDSFIFDSFKKQSYRPKNTINIYKESLQAYKIDGCLCNKQAYFSLPVQETKNRKIALLSACELEYILSSAFHLNSIDLNDWELQLVRKDNYQNKIIFDTCKPVAPTHRRINKPPTRLNKYTESFEIKPKLKYTRSCSNNSRERLYYTAPRGTQTESQVYRSKYSNTKRISPKKFLPTNQEKYSSEIFIRLENYEQKDLEDKINNHVLKKTTPYDVERKNSELLLPKRRKSENLQKRVSKTSTPKEEEGQTTGRILKDNYQFDLSKDTIYPGSEILKKMSHMSLSKINFLQSSHKTIDLSKDPLNFEDKKVRVPDKVTSGEEEGIEEEYEEKKVIRKSRCKCPQEKSDKNGSKPEEQTGIMQKLKERFRWKNKTKMCRNTSTSPESSRKDMHVRFSKNIYKNRHLRKLQFKDFITPELNRNRKKSNKKINTDISEEFDIPKQIIKNPKGPQEKNSKHESRQEKKSRQQRKSQTESPDSGSSRGKSSRHLSRCPKAQPSNRQRKIFMCYCGKAPKKHCKNFGNLQMDHVEGYGYCERDFCHCRRNKGSQCKRNYVDDPESSMEQVGTRFIPKGETENTDTESWFCYKGSRPEIDCIINRNLKKVYKNFHQASTFLYSVNNWHPESNLDLESRKLCQPRTYESLQQKICDIKNNKDEYIECGSQRTIIFESVERKNMQCQCFDVKQTSLKNESLTFKRPQSRNNSVSIRSETSLFHIFEDQEPKSTPSKVLIGKIPPAPPPIDFFDCVEIDY